MLKMTLPEGYTIETLPEQKVMLLPDNAGKFVYSVSKNGNTINLTSQFLINKHLFGVREYSVLKESFDLIISKQSEQLVLRKSKISSK